MSFSRRASHGGHRIRTFDRGNAGDLRDCLRANVAGDAAAIAIFHGADALADLRRAASNAVAEGDGSGLGIEHVVQRAFVAIFEAVDRLPIGPARSFFNLYMGRANDYRPMNQLVGLARIRVAGADKLGRRLDHLYYFRRVDSDEQQLAKRAGRITPRGAQPKNYILCELLIFDLRRKAVGALQIRIGRSEDSQGRDVVWQPKLDYTLTRQSLRRISFDLERRKGWLLVAVDDSG